MMHRVTGYRWALGLAVLGLVLSAVLGPAAFASLSTDEPADEEEPPVEEFRSEDSAEGDSDEGASAPEAAPQEPPADEPSSRSAPSLLPPPAVLAVLVMVVFTVCLIGSLATGLLVHEGVRTGVLLAALGPLLAKIVRGENATLSRGRILGYIEAHPGIHFSALRDALGLANGVTSHHLHVLEGEGHLLSWANGSRRRYAASGIDPTTIATLQNPVTGMQRAILETLSASSQLGLSATDLRKRLEATRQLMSYHLSRLDERALVAREGKGRKARWALTKGGLSLLTAQVDAAI